MSDRANAAALKSGRQAAPNGADGEGVLDSLRRLAVNDGSDGSSGGSDGQHMNGFGGAGSSSSRDASGERCARPPSPSDLSSHSFRVDRNAAWLCSTSERLAPMLEAGLIPACLHPRAGVRKALVALCARLSDSCGASLGCGEVARVILRCMMQLALDNSTEIAQEARGSLLRAVTSRPAWREAVESSFTSSLAELKRAVEGKASAGVVVARARRLAAAVQMAGARGLWRVALATRADVRSLALDLIAMLRLRVSAHTKAEHRPAGAVVALRKEHEPPTSTEGDAAQDELATSGVHSTSKLAGADTAVGRASEGASGMQPHAPDAVASALPRMPPALAHDMSQEAYNAIAHAIRGIGHVLARADAAGTGAKAVEGGRGIGSVMPHARSFRALCSELTSLLRAAATSLERHMPRGLDRNSSVGHVALAPQSALRDGSALAASLDRERAASAAVVLAELIYGASKCCDDGRFWDHIEDEGAAAISEGTVPRSRTHGRGSTAASQKGEAVSGALECVLVVSADAIDEVLNPSLWESAGGAIGEDSVSPLLTGVDRTCVTVSQQALLEVLGTLARACGAGFSSSARLLAATLYPLLQAFGADGRAGGSVEASSSAHAALLALCEAGGHASLRGLIASNTDYIVDALCRGMRHIELHPRSPELFRAVMCKAGADTASDILPIIAEPMRTVVKVRGRCRGAHAYVWRNYPLQ